MSVRHVKSVICMSLLIILLAAMLEGSKNL